MTLAGPVFSLLGWWGLGFPLVFLGPCVVLLQMKFGHLFPWAAVPEPRREGNIWTREKLEETASRSGKINITDALLDWEGQRGVARR